MKVLPRGITDYNELITDDVYNVDKTFFIEDLLKQKDKVTLITRPRRFGKTLNMSMLYYFFDITRNSEDLFRNKKIADCEHYYELNKYPTLFLSFANVAGDKEDLIENIKDIIHKQYKKYDYVFQNLDKYDKRKYQRILDALSGNFDDLKHVPLSLEFLMEKLEAYYYQKVIVLIDEYDQPFIEAHMNGYYDEIHKQLSLLLSKTLKDNIHLKQAVLTGVQRVAKESIFSKLNNPAVCTVADDLYSSYFGFTEDETREALEYYGLALNEEVKDMYDGYRIGNYDIYNPWSIINYINTKILEPYWVNTSANKMIKDSMNKIRLDMNQIKSFHMKYDSLITDGQTIISSLDLSTSFYESPSVNSLFGLLVNAGYLTIEKIERMNRIRKFYLRIPNDEVKEEFKRLTAYRLDNDDMLMSDMFESLLNKDVDGFINGYRDFILTSVSGRDLIAENSFHMLLVGLCAYLRPIYHITSNREEGEGYYDILLESKYPENPHVLMELKYTKEEDVDLKVLAKKATDQIIKKGYDYELKGEVLYIGIAHCHKKIENDYRI